jgi:hypothetical protein
MDCNWQSLLLSALSPVGYLVAAQSKERLRARSASMRLAKVTVNGTTKYRYPKRRDRSAGNCALVRSSALLSARARPLVCWNAARNGIPVMRLLPCHVHCRLTVDQFARGAREEAILSAASRR